MSRHNERQTLTSLDRLHELTGLPMEYLMGLTDNKSYDTAYGDRELGLSTASIEKLRDNGAHRDILDLLIQHKKFNDWINLINDRLLNLSYQFTARKAMSKYPDATQTLGEYETYYENEGHIIAHLLAETLSDMLKDETVFLIYARKISRGEYGDEPLTDSFASTIRYWLPRSQLSFGQTLHILEENKRREAESDAQQER